MPTTTETYTQLARYYALTSSTPFQDGTTWTTRYTYTTLGNSRTVPEPRPKAWAIARMRANECATTSLTGTKQYLEITPCWCAHRRKQTSYLGKYYREYQELGGDGVLALNPTVGTLIPPTADSLSSTDALNQAKGKYIKAYIDAVGEVQSLTIAGEGLKTISSIVRPGKALRNALNAWSKRAERIARRSRIKNGRLLRPEVRRVAVEKAITGSYLEWVFGVKPVLIDLDSAARALAEMSVQERDWSKDIRGFGESHLESKTYTGINLAKNSNTLTYDCWKNADVKVILRGKVVLTPSQRLRMQKVGLTLDRFVPQLYELMPYSWLIDYFSNLGRVIDGLALNWADLRWTQLTIIQDSWTESRNIKHTVGTPSTVDQYWFSPGSFEWHKRGVTRSQYFGSLTPSLQFRIPGSGTQWCNIAAVVTQGRAVERLITRLLK